MHFGKAGELLLHLVIRRGGVLDIEASFFQQARDHLNAAFLQPGAHFALHHFGNLLRLAGRHHGHEAIRQCGSEQRVGVGCSAIPLAVIEQFVGKVHLVTQPQIDLRNTTQAWKQNRIRAKLFADRTHRLPGQSRQQVRAGPEIIHLARGGDERLHRADRHGEQRHLALGIIREGAGKGGSEIEVIPERMIGDAGIGRQQLPQRAKLAVVVGFAQFRAEAPVGEQNLAQVSRRIAHSAERD